MAAASATGTCKGGIEAYRKLREYERLDLDVVAVPRPSWALARPRRLQRASIAGGGLAGAAPRPGGLAASRVPAWRPRAADPARGVAAPVGGAPP
jgi:hypothetical protein